MAEEFITLIAASAARKEVEGADFYPAHTTGLPVTFALSDIRIVLWDSYTLDRQSTPLARLYIASQPKRVYLVVGADARELARRFGALPLAQEFFDGYGGDDAEGAE